MFDAPALSPPDPGSSSGAGLALRLPADAYWHLIHALRLALPPPPAKAGVADSPDDLARRDHAAIARIAALAPANAAEADLAAQFVAASEQWKDCLRLAQEPEATQEWAHKCRAQANAMMRQANSALRLLLRLQEARRKLEADNAAADRAAWTEHCAVGLMAEALAPGASPAATSLSRAAGAGEGSAGAAGEIARAGLGEGASPDTGAPPNVSPSDPVSLPTHNETALRPASTGIDAGPDQAAAVTSITVAGPEPRTTSSRSASASAIQPAVGA